MKPALLIINPQNSYFTSHNTNLPAFEATLPVINAAIALCREEGWSLAFLQHTSEHLPIGSAPWSISDLFDWRPVDTRMTKTKQNAFWNTGLDALLRSQRIDTVVLAGYESERCVLSTLRGAEERGYKAAILDGGVAGLNDEFTRFTLEVSPRISLEGLQALSTRSSIGSLRP